MGRFSDTQISTPTGYGGNNAFNNFPQSRPNFKKTNPNPSPRIPLSINRSKLSIPFKSRLCFLFQKGKCYYGENCHFSHSSSDIGNPRLNGVVIGRHSNKGSSTEEYCSTGEVCTYGGNCVYKAPEGYYFNRVRKKNCLCKQWERFGRCSYGVMCIFAHGKAELQQLGSPAETPYQYTPKTSLAASQPNNKPARESGIKIADNRLQPTDERCFLKWDVEKMSEIYGDWIGERQNLHFR
ncbi:hypothetical protein BUALT_Bualt07G0133400 [Buddleja alternifolia]|uniref:C3H1-type domain-containing protein n=1 Tax=Buddleja alternifolia TaxID=168488 RepID=A0AAV6XH51_9LAMI|nr:hypothetical protein BUALT_Bualt07G0133400 [Buddleja alternifolia]